jgi:hypothetical protein
MTDAERREKARLRSERWRRAHGIMPRRPAQKPWLAEGVSRSTWYRRRKQAGKISSDFSDAIGGGKIGDFSTNLYPSEKSDRLARASAFVSQLQAELAAAVPSVREAIEHVIAPLRLTNAWQSGNGREWGALMARPRQTRRWPGARFPRRP